MVIFGGLEFVVGGYFIHRHYKNKNRLEKDRLEDEAQERRCNTFPGAKPQSSSAQQPSVPQYKYEYRVQQPQPPTHPHTRPQPHPYASQAPPRAQSFMIPRRPVPPRKLELQHEIQPLQRSDSMATLSRMPIANGYRPTDSPGHNPPLPPRRQQSSLLSLPQDEPANYPYSNAGFSVSTPALAAPSSFSPITPTSDGPPGRGTVDDNWETYATQPQPQYGGPAASGPARHEDSEDDPPPPYLP
ncbi:hypothetical protein BDV95DRAFT_39983 [Massariosphaeria phaeospora]|uniref:Uncharacterized protein n=1 Tax=Massariosphaeria phaeospora TaxID=100035 RepID=A0A7C8M860_9PLEO|nr:hypothetical protein BDV95DRAFT_39983 [Massariosphaeria phaeospora]